MSAEHLGANANRNETPGGRLDRQWAELLQEVRVAQTGIQMLGGFLLIVPFQMRFTELTSALRLLYLFAMGSATLALFLILSPVVTHRTLFRALRRDLLVTWADRLVRLGLVLVAVTVIATTALTFGFVLGERAAIIAGVIATSTVLVLWWVLAAFLHRQPITGSYTRQ